MNGMNVAPNTPWKQMYRPPRDLFIEVRKEVKENWGMHDLIYAMHLHYLFIRAHSNY